MSSQKRIVPQARPEVRYRQLKGALAETGYILPGSLVKRFMPCGKAFCRCAKGPRHYHGPYYQWSVALRGKPVAIRLTAAQARLYREWIHNNQKVRKILDEMRGISMRVAKPQKDDSSRR